VWYNGEIRGYFCAENGQLFKNSIEKGGFAMNDKERNKKRLELVALAAVCATVATVADKAVKEAKWAPLRRAEKILIYEMYPRSWAGGLPEMTEHLYRLKALQVDYVWLAPCYPSGGVDGGYDITDYQAIDSQLGTIEDFDNFVRTADSLGMKVVMDLVLNHTSDQHPWFQKSAAGDPQYADYYLWSDTDLGWGTMFDGSPAFEWNETRGQFYCHIYNRAQPDLNWENPAVMNEFQEIIDFWTNEHGVAGFRVDSAGLIGKDFSRAYLPRGIVGTAAGLPHYYHKQRTIDIYHELFDGRDLFTFGEFGAPLKGMFSEMVAPDGPLSAGMNVVATNAYRQRLGFLAAKPSMERAQRLLKDWSQHPAFVANLESHDTPRFTSLAGVSGQEALTMLFAADPQIVCLYQGQELGLKNPELSDNISEHQDIQTLMRYHTRVQKGEDPEEVLEELKPLSRDNARATIPLDEYDAQMADPDSCYSTACELSRQWKGE